MAQTTVEKQILERLDKVEKTMNQILEHLEDAKLSNEEKQLLDGSFEREKGN